MIKGRILATEIGGNPVAGSCELVYQDALASGTNEYVSVTYVLVKDDSNKCHIVRPRDIIEVIPEKTARKKNFTFTKDLIRG